ncbi:MAG: metal-sulfur cluster assembly factor [Candidatus Kerfeldbacteria bacterium]|nr:metal-sulfur cluster assembly factor [Candidatus Kerfeldbacteria bacterium]
MSLSVAQVLDALRKIKDPELGLDLVSLGLIYETRLTDGHVYVRCTLTTPGCPLISTIIEDVRAAIGRLPGVTNVKVELTFDPPWTPDKMNAEAAELLGFARATTATVPGRNAT